MMDSPTPDDEQVYGQVAEDMASAMFLLLPEGVDFVENIEWHTPRGLQIVVWPMRLHVHTQECFRA
jgi:hypothetical protein